MTWTNLSFGFESILTAVKMTQLDDNFEAFANGDSGSPKIQEGAVTGQACADRTAFKTEVQTRAGTFTASSTISIAGAFYSFFFNIHDSNVGGNDVRIKGYPSDIGDDRARFGFRNASPKINYTYDVDNRYINE